MNVMSEGVLFFVSQPRNSQLPAEPKYVSRMAEVVSMISQSLYLIGFQ